MMGHPASVVSANSWEAMRKKPYNLIETLCSSQTGGACANDEDVDVDLFVGGEV